MLGSTKLSLSQRARNEHPTKRFARAEKYLPPVILRIAKYVFADMKYCPRGWHPRDSRSRGWEDKSIADAQQRHWPILLQNLQGVGPLGVSHFPWSMTREDRTDHNVMMSYGYVLARAARKKDRITILDWGGGVGHYYLYSIALVPDVAVTYDCYDLPHLCRLGRTLLPEVQFHDSLGELVGKKYDLVLNSSSLHYFENWREVTAKLAAAAQEYLYIARLQTVNDAPSFVVLHRVHRAGYSEFQSWFINREELVSRVKESGLELLREFLFTEKWRIRGAPAKVEGRGFLFQRR
jgi:putative methyltransferase (TIGR04325 family)